MSTPLHEPVNGPSEYELSGSAPTPIRDAPSHVAHRLDIRLVTSAEPRVVFTSLAASTVPGFCDECSVSLVDSDAAGAAARFHLSLPPLAAGSGGVDRVTARAAAQSAHVVRVGFAFIAATRNAEITSDTAASAAPVVQGEVVFVWNRRPATRVDRVAAEALVGQAVQLVEQQRSEQAAASASSAVVNLTAALKSSRQIGMAMGILMSLLQITQDEAFEALRLASQRANRKLRDVATDVVETGWLDPDLLQR
ncbi:ANTAR domain-containing protein [uncultured Jatrophihabitans sp.]|uniref:ANTAR domain-containing protein n=1 Tax=uncultured Jatrophihabitans sp. TaxID=1610747 RepID=UPI0035C9BE97